MPPITVDTPDVMDVFSDPGQSLVHSRDVDPVLELQRFEAAAQLQTKLVVASIKATKPQDWVQMGDKVYLQGTGVERVAALWGLVFGVPKIEKLDLPGGNYAYSVTGPVGSRRTGVYMAAVEGGRSSDDPFFDRFDDEKPHEFFKLPKDEQKEWKRTHRIPPDELDVRKAAVTNWQNRGASMLTGLRGLTPKDLQDAGIVGYAKVEYGKGAKGGDTAPADIKAEQVKLRNELLQRTGGDTEAASKLLVDITKTDKFAGSKNVDFMKQDWQFKAAWKNLAEHPVFGDKPSAE